VTSRKLKARTPVYSAIAMLVLTFAPGELCGQTTSGAASALPPSAEEALSKGIIAAKLPDYRLAIHFFEQARKIAPQAPIIYLNLGLAESRVPGRELRAMAWFGAYLVGNPSASNAAAVKDEITALGVRNQSNVFRLIGTLQDAASKIPRAIYQNSIVARLQAEAGDIVGALKTVDLIEDDYKTDALVDVARAQTVRGDTAGAQETLRMALRNIHFVVVGVIKASSRHEIARAQAAAGAIADAQRYSDSLPTGYDKAEMQAAIATAQAKAGAISDAQQTVDLVPNSHGKKTAAQLAIALAQAKAGAMNVARNGVNFLPIGWEKVQAQLAIAEAQQDAGNGAGVQESMAAARDTYALLDTGTAHLLAGILISRSEAKNALSKVTRDVSGWLKFLDDDCDGCGHDLALNTRPFLDLAGLLESTKSARPEDAGWHFEFLESTIGVLVSAQSVIESKLKAQAKP
jgi:tetratricopeptide (TPR) repeat protein